MQAYLDDFSKITIEMESSSDGSIPTFMLFDMHSYSPLTNRKIEFVNGVTIYKVNLVSHIDFSKNYYVYNDAGEFTLLKFRGVLKTRRFDLTYYYGGKLGSYYTTKSTKFYLWAPTAHNVCVEIYDADTLEIIKTVNLERHKKGLWFIEVDGDLEALAYNYIVSVNGAVNRTYDPYAISTAPNRSGSYIIDREKIIRRKDFINKTKITEAIIYETNVRDFSSDKNQVFSSDSYFKRFHEKNVTNNYNDKIGFDYIKKLGITHIQLLPVTDYGSVDDYNIFENYNWGYDVMQHTALKPMYCSDFIDPYCQITELQNLIHQYHENGIGIILDVVYNHVYQRDLFALELITPGYNYRYVNHEFSDGAGCGNELASECKMIRKYIVESLVTLHDVYQVDGFRFDLMGLLDRETMWEVSNYFYPKNVYIYGEGWNLDSSLHYVDKSIVENGHCIPKVGFYSSTFRDIVKGNNFNIHDPGISSCNHEVYGSIRNILFGGILDSNLNIDQMINYVSGHDNHTLYDYFQLKDQGVYSYYGIKNSFNLLLLAQGACMLHAGDEFLRSKQLVENSYNSNDEINQITWDDVSANKHLVSHVSNLIKIRKFFKPITLANSADIIKKCHVYVEGDSIHYTIHDKKQFSKYNEIYIIFNLNHEKLYIDKKFDKFKCALINDSIDLESGLTLDKMLIIEPASIAVLYR